MLQKINLPIEWKAFKNSQFGRNFTFKTRQIYERAEQILFVLLADILEASSEKMEVEESDIHRRIVKQIGGVAKRRFPNLSPTSLNIYIRVWNTFLNSLHKDELIQKKAKIERLQEHKKERRALSDEQIAKLTSAKIGPKDGLNLHRVHTMVLTSLGTGARLNDVSMLRAEDLNFPQYLINIYSGKGRKQRVVPMSPALAKTLFRFAQRRDVPANNLIFGSKVRRSSRSKLKSPKIKYPYTRMSSSNVVRDLAALCEHLQIPRFKFHELRHTFATRYLKNGGNIAKLKQLMGHTSILTTMIYEHMDKDAVFENFSDYTPF